MGMYDKIKYEMDCPTCGVRVTGFQSKDKDCKLATLEFWEVDNFYALCPKCSTWIEFNRKEPRTPSPIGDYEMTVEDNAS